MKERLLATGAGEDSFVGIMTGRTPIELRIEDSLKSIAVPIRGASTAMVVVLIGSLAVHAILLVTAVVSGWAPPKPPQQEIAVEIVHDVPKPKAQDAPKPQAAPKSQQAKRDQAAPAAAKPPPVAKADPPKADPSKAESPKPTPPKPAPPKPKTSKPEPPKQAAAKPEPPPQKAATAKVEPKPPVTPQPKPATPPTKPAAPPAKSAEDAKEIEELQKQLAQLRSQQSELNDELKTASAADQSAAAPDPQANPLANSLRAIALPAIGEGEGEAVGYQQLVFSQLAKAKGDGEYHGPAGTTGVRFAVDDAGQLLHVEVANSSGNPSLDRQALDIVHRAAPFPPPPKGSDHSFSAYVHFVPSKT